MPTYRIMNAKDHNLRHGQQIHVPVKREKGKDDGSAFVSIVDPGYKPAPIGADGSTSMPATSGEAHISCTEKNADALRDQGYELEELDEDGTREPAAPAGAAKPDEIPSDVEQKPRDPFETPEDRDLKRQQQRNAKLQSHASAEEQALRESEADRKARIAENQALAEKGATQAGQTPSKDDVLKESRKKG